MEKIGLIAVVIVSAVFTYIAVSKPITVIRWMHAWRSSWSRMSGRNVLTHEQSAMHDLAQHDTLEYERKYSGQLNLVRAAGIVSLLIVVASLCMLFN